MSYTPTGFQRIYKADVFSRPLAKFNFLVTRARKYNKMTAVSRLLPCFAFALIPCTVPAVLQVHYMRMHPPDRWINIIMRVPTGLFRSFHEMKRFLNEKPSNFITNNFINSKDFLQTQHTLTIMKHLDLHAKANIN